EAVKEAVQTQAVDWLRAVLERAQEENADFMGLGRMAGASQPEKWKLLTEQWEEKFPQLDIRVRCTVVLTDMRR
ncbi:MAG: hypothetical protein IJZ66_01755, partial [Oscillibacter sp.]|nr:hypothetical protein [Oscillibacter sp.]